MEKRPRQFSGKNYWKGNGYVALDGAAERRRMETVTIGGGRRGFWRVKKAPCRVAMRVGITPKQLWNRLRDAYVRLMVRVAGRAGRLEAAPGELPVGRRRMARAAALPDKQRVEAFESRLVLEIYKALATSRGLSEV